MQRPQVQSEAQVAERAGKQQQQQRRKKEESKRRQKNKARQEEDDGAEDGSGNYYSSSRTSAAQPSRARSSRSAKNRAVGNTMGDRPPESVILYPNDDTCNVCGFIDGSGGDEDLLVICETCEIAVHQQCYGVHVIPEGDWFCKGCDPDIGGSVLDPKKPHCVLCPVAGGALQAINSEDTMILQMQDMMDGMGSGQWVHTACAYQCPDVTWTQENLKDEPFDLATISTERFELPCSYCTLQLGGVLQCSFPKCYNAFHVFCGRLQGCVTVYTTDGLPMAFCDKHSKETDEDKREELRKTTTQETIDAGVAAERREQQQREQAQYKIEDANRRQKEENNKRVQDASWNATTKRAQFLVSNFELIKPLFVDLNPQEMLVAAQQAVTAAPSNSRADGEDEEDDMTMRMDAGYVVEAGNYHASSTLSALQSIQNRQVYPEAQPVPLPTDGQPSCIKFGKMRQYQLDGLRWMLNQHDQGAGGILGDDMGLGKTLQVISLFGFLHHERGESGPHLVVAPLSVVSTWQNELAQWCPSLRVVKMHGTENERKRVKTQTGMVNGQFDVCVTTYEMLLAEIKYFSESFSFRYMILDEAQRVKNELSLVGKAVRRVNRAHTLLLTGTPIQNNMHELWSLLNLLYPECFGGNAWKPYMNNGVEKYEKVEAKFQVTARSFLLFNLAGKDPQAGKRFMSTAHAFLNKVMLRRTKQDVFTHEVLPPKTERVLQVPLSPMQKYYYTKMLREQSEARSGGGGKDRGRMANLLVQLRKCCNHPYLLDYEEVASQQFIDERMVASSGKMTVLDKLLTKLQAEAHKCLIFSQFTTMLDILQDYLDWKGHGYFRLDGSTTPARRRWFMSQFQKPDSANVHKFIFLISTKAGGLGLNLQAADTVILYDSDWNPTNDKQAMDRVHRMGQKRPVTVYRFVSSGTCEERILHAATQKMSMSMKVLEDGESQGVAAVDDAEEVHWDDKELDEITSFSGTDSQTSDSGPPDVSLESAQSFLDSVNVEKLLAMKAIPSPVKAEAPPAQVANGDNSDAAAPAAAGGAAANGDGAEGGKKRELSTNVRNFGGVEYDTDAKPAAASAGSTGELVSHKRQRKNNIVFIDTGERGLGRVAVPRWQLDEEQAAENKAAARKAAAASKVKAKITHDPNCMICNLPASGPPPPERAPQVAQWEEAKQKSAMDIQRDAIPCHRCPRVMHAACCPTEPKDCARQQWTCCQHTCQHCGRGGSDCGGLLFRCVKCVSSVCYECFEERGEARSFDHVSQYEPWAQAFKPSTTSEYMLCGACNERQGQEEVLGSPKSDRV